MTAITASMVKELREQTGAGMMDCKKALSESAGDISAAQDWLRKKGLSAAAKKSSRTAAEGLVAVATNGTTAAMVEINAETDFVSRNDQFQKFVSAAAVVALDSGSTVDTLASATFPSTGKSVADSVTDLVATIGENMVLRRSQNISVSQGAVVSYLHNASSDTTGRIGVIVGLESTGDVTKLRELGRKIAMHIAATNPQALNIEDMDQTVVAAERTLLEDQAKSSGKPVEFIGKMVDGRMRKFFEQVVLMEQEFVMNPDLSVKGVIAETATELGCDIKMTQYVRFALGEGIEKEVTDFAAEVAAQLGS